MIPLLGPTLCISTFCPTTQDAAPLWQSCRSTSGPGLSLGSPVVSITIEYPDLQHYCRGGDKVGGEIVEVESNLDG